MVALGGGLRSSWSFKTLDLSSVQQVFEESLLVLRLMPWVRSVQSPVPPCSSRAAVCTHCCTDITWGFVTEVQ